MKDLFLYLQLAILIMNITAFIFIMGEAKYEYKAVRAALLIVLSAGMLVNIGKITFLTVLFSFAPFLSLINIQQHGTIHKHIEKFRGYFGRDKQHMENVQGSNKALSRQKA